MSALVWFCAEAVVGESVVVIKKLLQLHVSYLYTWCTCWKGGVRVPKGGRGSGVERWRLKSVALGSIPGGCPDFFSSS